VPLIVGFARAVELCVDDLKAEATRILVLREALWWQLSSAMDGVECNGHITRRLPGNLNVSFPDVTADQLLIGLPEIALSTGSACASASSEPSHVLKALGLSDQRARASLRFGIGRANTAEEVAWVAKRLVEVVSGLQQAHGASGGSGRK
jgi:cysteine desulfurase